MATAQRFSGMRSFTPRLEVEIVSSRARAEKEDQSQEMDKLPSEVGSVSGRASDLGTCFDDSSCSGTISWAVRFSHLCSFLLTCSELSHFFLQKYSR
mmetsp:Transcript_26038/g.102300  ORF Transcript_26038/g.102300 Transcript_26038/m.102300 type:complete len:97 (-) Transcript_26038:1618-1908(-)